MDSVFMVTVAEAVGASGIRVVRFEFPYMAARRTDGRRRAPDREPVLIESWLGVIGKLGKPARLVIGGKSLGGRIASMVADQAGVAGLVCLGYPFHPPGNPLRTRTKHLEKLQTPALILQGERDSFGRRDESGGLQVVTENRDRMARSWRSLFKPPARSGRTEAQNVAEAIARVCAFITRLRVREGS